jgi:RNA polymerase sigma-70 factor (ECF subfamily)
MGMTINHPAKTPPDDCELMTAIAQGDTSELGRLYLRHKERVLVLAYRILGQWNLAEDVCQEAFLRVYQGAEKYKPEAEFTTWLYRIVVNLCMDEKRKTQRTQIMLHHQEESRHTDRNKGGAQTEKTDTSDAIWKAIQTLNPRQKQVVILHKIEGLNYTEISNKTGWTKSAIESLLGRAYKRLRNELIIQQKNNP